MALITIQRDPSGITGKDAFDVEGQINLKQWLIDNETSDFAGLHAVIKHNGIVICDTTEHDFEQCNNAIDIDIGLFDRVEIILRPKGIELTVYQLFAIAVIAAGVAIALAPRPNIKNLNDRTSTASNNQLNASSNSYRPNQAIPDIGGQVVSYPDFVQPSYYEYISGQRVYDEWLCIGVGKYDVSEVRVGDDLIDNILGSSYDIYDVDSVYPELKIVNRVGESIDVDLLPSIISTGYVNGVNGQWLEATNELIIGSVAVTKLNPQPGNVLSLNLTGYYIDGGDTITVTVTGDFTVSSSSGGSIIFTADIYPQDFVVTNGSISNNNFIPAERYYTLKGDAIDEVWFQLVMPTGIRKGDGTTATVTATLTVEEIDAFGVPTGVNIFSIGAEFTGNTQEAQRATFKITAADGLVPSRYRAKAVRITDSLGDNALDLLTMEGVESVTYYTPDFGDVTVLNVKRSSNQRVDRGGSTKINALVNRKLRIYDNDTGIYGLTYETTRRFCDYAFYVLHELMNVPIDQIDTDALFGIHDSLSDAQLGYFDGTFDSKDVSARDRLEIICNAARVRYWNDGLTWSFVREEANQVRSLLFNRRNLKAGSGAFEQTFPTPNDYDSVTIIYVDPLSNAEKRISKKIVSGVISTGEGIRPLEFDFKVGIRNDLQAQNRLDLEIRRVLYRPVSVQDTALNDALLARLGSRVAWVDIMDLSTFDGEILGVNGNVYTTSERFAPVDGETYYVFITDNVGGVSNSVICTARSDGNIYGFEATGLFGAYLSGGIIGAGSRYIIAPSSDLAVTDFTVVSRGRPNEVGECQITLSEYLPELFEAD